MMKFLIITVLLSVTLAEHFYVVNPATGFACIILDANITGTLHYVNGKNTTNFAFAVNGTGLFSPTFNGNCQIKHNNESAQSLEINFIPNGRANATGASQWKLEMFFVSKAEGKSFELADYTLTTSAATPGFPYAREFKKSDKATVDVAASEVNGFKCSMSELPLESAGKLELKNLRAIAFSLLNSTEFGPKQEFNVCSLDSRTSDIVPIIVGACLAGLVVIVLVAYMIGRARANRTGYASV